MAETKITGPADESGGAVQSNPDFPSIVGQCFFFNDGITPPGFFSNFGFDPVFDVNGVGDISLTLIDPLGLTANLTFATGVLSLDGLAKTITLLAGVPGVARVLTTQIGGVPIDTPFSLTVFRVR